jgi:hypothetical protein
MLNEINLMLEPNIVKIQHGIRAKDLKEPLHKFKANRHLPAAEPYDPSRVSRKRYDPLLFWLFQHPTLKRWG